MLNIDFDNQYAFYLFCCTFMMFFPHISCCALGIIFARPKWTFIFFSYETNVLIII